MTSEWTLGVERGGWRGRGSGDVASHALGDDRISSTTLKQATFAILALHVNVQSAPASMKSEANHVPDSEYTDTNSGYESRIPERMGPSDNGGETANTRIGPEKSQSGIWRVMQLSA